jgi:hypothetical protein
MLTQQRLKELLHYDPCTGVFTWLVDRGGRAKAGCVAGARTRHYRKIVVDDRPYYGHDLAWLYMTGSWADLIDHIDTSQGDVWLNLRIADKSKNGANRGKPANNTSGSKGVWRRGNRWTARITVNGQRLNLGTFATKEEAEAAYSTAAAIEFGSFARAA